MLPAGVGVYAATAALTLVGAWWWNGSAADSWTPFVVAILGATVPLALGLALRFGIGFDRVIGVLALAMMLVAVHGIVRGWIPPRPYGDGPHVIDFLEKGYVFPRWLLGMAIALWLYLGVWRFPPIASAVPASIGGAAVFAALLCAVAMGVGALLVLQRWPDRLAVILPMLTPVWLLFASGYVEYYPLVAAAWLASLAWMFERPLEDRPPWAIGALVGSLPLMYLPLAPVSALLFVAYAMRRRTAIVSAAAIAVGVFAIIVTVTFGNIPMFISTLYGEMNFGDYHSPARYVGQAAGPSSIFFASRHALRSRHLREVFYALFWAGGWVTLPIVASVAIIAVRRCHAWWRDARAWLGAVLVGWFIYYSVFMIPKLEPARDVDLFWPAYLAWAFISGRLVDAARTSSRARYLVLCVVTGASIAVSGFLLLGKLPRL